MAAAFEAGPRVRPVSRARAGLGTSPGRLFSLPEPAAHCYSRFKKSAEASSPEGSTGSWAMMARIPLLLDPQPEGGYTVTSPLLPELITEGDTIAEALANAEDAFAAVVEVYEDRGAPTAIEYIRALGPEAPSPWAERTPRLRRVTPFRRSPSPSAASRPRRRRPRRCPWCGSPRPALPARPARSPGPRLRARASGAAAAPG